MPAFRDPFVAVLALAAGLLVPAGAQRPDISGTWERVNPAPPAAEWARAQPGAAPCDASEAQLRLLRLYAQPPQRFTTTQRETTLVVTGAGGSSISYYLDGREEKVSMGGLEVVYRAWTTDNVLTIEWKPQFGGTVRESYTLADGAALLQLDQTVEHPALSRPVRQRVAYRRSVEPTPQNPSAAGAQAAVGQVADTAFRPVIERPAYPAGSGPAVLIDEAHANFHTATGRYLPFAELLRRDGYIVKGSTERWTPELLRTTKILVMANAQRAPAAEEVTAVRAWVTGGGSLLLIVDHPPFVEASADLAKTFGIRLLNRGAADPGTGRLTFRKSDGTLKDHAITEGIDAVVTFTGSSFEIDDAGQPLLVFGPTVCSSGLDPNPVALQGHLQGGVLAAGAGRVAVFAEAAMFSAQVTGPSRSPMGMNDPSARQNAPFLLNVVHWLSGAK